MGRLRFSRALLGAALVFGVAAPVTFAEAAPVRAPGAGDVTVVAVIDSGLSPYHWDFLASKMPQAKNKDRSDDLPLTVAPDKWLPGFPKPGAFSSYQSMKLTLDTKDDLRSQKELHDKDQKTWDKFKQSGPNGINYHWFPGTKVIGGLSFEAEQPSERVTANPSPFYGSGGSEHGTGVASVSTGNIYGTCPECLLVFLQYSDYASGNRAIEWALNQPWIDVVTNSYGFHTVGSTATRDNVYGGANTDAQKKASERGQTVFWSAGNGYENGFATPNQTILSSQKGPDWIITVTAATPNGKSNYTGAGKPADLAGIGSGYPSAYGSTRVTGGSSFSGTSNATPTVAGTYARALYLSRRAMKGNSRVQARGVIATGKFRCGTKRRNCELGDGKLTATELRTRLLHGAVHRTDSHSPAGFAPQKFASDERYMVEGHGTYMARVKQDNKQWLDEFNLVLKPLFGLAATKSRPEDERLWMIVDSWCRQKIWGKWGGGYYVEGKTKLPADDQAHPTRASYRNSCEGMQRPPSVPPL